MKLQSDNLEDYLKITSIIDWDKPEIIRQTNAIIQGLEHDVDKTRALFEWVRDTIPHSRDIGSDIVTCSASEVLNRMTGICFAKSHLLAAMLRSASIPAGFCYQVFRRNAPYKGLALHGLNGIYIESLSRWIRVDARGNRGSIDAQFSIDEERLAFPIDHERGEFLYETIYTDPALVVVNVLKRFTSLKKMWQHLPEPFEEAMSGENVGNKI